MGDSIHRFLVTVALVFAGQLLSFLSIAQLSIAPHLTLNRTALPNDGDTSGGGPVTLDYKPTYRVTGGVDIGYRFETGFGLSGLFIGLDYTPVAQKYDFGYDMPGQNPPSFNHSSTTSLNYLRASLSTEFTLVGREGGWRLTLAPGFYAGRLLFYRDGWSESSRNHSYFLTNSFRSIGLDTVYVSGDAYRKWDYGPQLALGAEFPLSENAALTFSLRSTYGIPNVENEDADLEILDEDYRLIIGAIKPWNYREKRFYVPLFSTMRVRTIPTHTFTAGANVGLRLTF